MRFLKQHQRVSIAVINIGPAIIAIPGGNDDSFNWIHTLLIGSRSVFVPRKLSRLWFPRPIEGRVSSDFSADSDHKRISGSPAFELISVFRLDLSRVPPALRPLQPAKDLLESSGQVAQRPRTITFEARPMHDR
jgi:hypothetical protein